MKQFGQIKKIKYINMIVSALLILTGIALLIWPEISVVTICYAVGAMVILTGIIRIIGYFSWDIYNLNFQFDFAMGIFLIILGFILVCHPKDIITMLHFVVGVIILIDGVFKLQTSLEAKHFGLSKWWIILCVSMICVLLGLLLIIHPFGTAKMVIRLMGIAVIADGLESIFMTLYTVKIHKKVGPISVEYTEIIDSDPEIKQ